MEDLVSENPPELPRVVLLRLHSNNGGHEWDCRNSNTYHFDKCVSVSLEVTTLKDESVGLTVKALVSVRGVGIGQRQEEIPI